MCEFSELNSVTSNGHEAGGRHPLVFVCVATGDLWGLANIYIDRMYGMLSRFSPGSFELVCITDQRRNLTSPVRQLDCSAWSEFKSPGTHPTFFKLGIFNPEYIDANEFYYMDLSLIIKAPLAPLINYASGQPEDLVIVRDWHYDGFNSSVMRIRNRGLRTVYDDYVNGVKYPETVPGDQDFILGAFRMHALSAAHFPDWMIVSFKKTMRMGLKDWKTWSLLAQRSVIVKFHGRPKMHKLFEGRASCKIRNLKFRSSLIRAQTTIYQVR